MIVDPRTGEHRHPVLQDVHSGAWSTRSATSTRTSLRCTRATSPTRRRACASGGRRPSTPASPWAPRRRAPTTAASSSRWPRWSRAAKMSSVAARSSASASARSARSQEEAADATPAGSSPSPAAGAGLVPAQRSSAMCDGRRLLAAVTLAGTLVAAQRRGPLPASRSSQLAERGTVPAPTRRRRRPWT